MNNWMDIEKKLESARERSAKFGALYGAKETADDFLKLKFAEIYDDAPDGSVAERDACVRRQTQ